MDGDEVLCGFERNERAILLGDFNTKVGRID